ncbi:MAG: hydroxymyristoyl-ACP dehydratase [Bacteroidales bacterium]|nr:hydroxymyristoyl-ACP dehydratase [Bacteroidales bacterium]
MEAKAMSSEMLHKQLLERMPYAPPFFFIDKIIEIDEKKVTATYYFSENLDFYKGHFKHKPVTPGVIQLEAMGQVGCVLHGIYLLGLHKNNLPFEPVLGLMEGNFFQPLYPNSLVTIESELQYFRQNYVSSICHIYDEQHKLMSMAKIQCSFLIYE